MGDAIKLLKDIGAYADYEKVVKTKQMRAGKGKMRNRRLVQRKGPMIVFPHRCRADRAFRNLPGVDVAYVDKLNILKLAPGGHFGRLLIWTKKAFLKVDNVLKGYKHRERLPDSKRVINSAEVQSVCRAKRRLPKKTKDNTRKPILNPAQPILAQRARLVQHRATIRNSNKLWRLVHHRARETRRKNIIRGLQRQAARKDKIMRLKRSTNPRTPKARKAPKPNRDKKKSFKELEAAKEIRQRVQKKKREKYISKAKKKAAAKKA
eukprot:NODE_2231_length_961_cov_236.430921_g1839_i0.p2 GENE.NODE_2231_length_961_cov_236.430921_g1839_i0~~NODE_2231_length_961_cov_236.430921_g1839_i0.p2  ORF type:complete len:264 (+),score=96.56 NODE_2231_length_961_cov_236.430921_g1839_i0:25-816(+)